MADSATVVPIRPAARARKQRAFPKDLKRALWKQQMRVYEALGVAQMLVGHITNAPASGFAGSDVDTLDNSARALVRLLKPVDGLDDAEHLLQLLAADEVANG